MRRARPQKFSNGTLVTQSMEWSLCGRGAGGKASMDWGPGRICRISTVRNKKSRHSRRRDGTSKIMEKKEETSEARAQGLYI